MSTLRILHLSDTHLRGDGGQHFGLVDTVAAYRLTLAAFENAGPLDLVVVSGDASDDGSPASYRILRSLTEEFAKHHGAVAIYAMGNHDERAGFRAVLGSGHPSTVQAETATEILTAADGSAGPIVGVSEVAGFRIITLDSSVPGRSHGAVDPAQLSWLRQVLATKFGQGTVIVIHHPPVESLTPLHHGIELLNPAGLATALTGSDTVAILSGHYHHHLYDTLIAGSDSIPVVVTSGVVNSNDILAAPGNERASAGSGGTLITISALAQHTRVRALPLRLQLPASVTPEVIFDLEPAEVASISAKISATDAERLDAGLPRTATSTATVPETKD